VAVILAHFRFSVIAFCVVATIKKCELVFEANSPLDCCNNTERNRIKTEVSKNAIFTLADLLIFE
jgi:hypothetical protein